MLLALFFELQFSDCDTVFTSIFSKLFIKSVKFKIFINTLKNLDYLSGSLTCRTFGKGRNMKVMVKKHDFLKNGSISDGLLCSVSQNLIVTGLLFGVGIVCSSLLF
jgi:hypothetical protein